MGLRDEKCRDNNERKDVEFYTGNVCGTDPYMNEDNYVLINSQGPYSLRPRELMVPNGYSIW